MSKTPHKSRKIRALRVPTDALKALDAWFKRQKRVLPWREDPSFYRVWVSEIMLQQTQVVTVVPYFERFIARFPDVTVLAQASEDEVMRYWAGLGYYSRARNLRKAAIQIVGQGEFPVTCEGWKTLPGVGDYTAGAILSIAANQPMPILDGNVERVLSRVYRVGRDGGDSEYKKRLWAYAEAWVTVAASLGVAPSNLNQALMETGALICKPKYPLCESCPIASDCQAKRKGEQELYPPKRARKKWVEVKEQAYCLLNSRGEVLLEKSAPGSWRAGLWDLPLERPSKLRGKKLGHVVTKHVVTHHRIVRETEVWQVSSGNRKAQHWASLKDMEVPVGSAFRKTLQKVRTSLLNG